MHCTLKHVYSSHHWDLAGYLLERSGLYSVLNREVPFGSQSVAGLQK